MKARSQRRVIVLDPHTAQIAQHFTRAAETIDLATALLRQQLNDAGWPGRSNQPAPTCQHQGDCTCPVIDYSDPTGEQANMTAHLHDQLDIIQDSRQLIQDQTAHLERVARRIIGTIEASEPLCEQCGTRSVEPTNQTRRRFRGVNNTLGLWWRTRDTKPAVCYTCRNPRKGHTE